MKIFDFYILDGSVVRPQLGMTLLTPWFGGSDSIKNQNACDTYDFLWTLGLFEGEWGQLPTSNFQLPDFEGVGYV